ncbi:hypothetical protein N7E81_04490 [Reichenbachiella carrageenanivorans]|uniref:Uncharacterized protein n=1 Tax=Reichenbachiella carrageenanivorans TaxID=2979869 RepID=A0ABY6D2G7_9BACT|nr:hypothetical protein [Reichenbachiella carrageenanivorans]UXX80356.1 hypothetical protein N7E81_04490 [Reichenbachiella carrageenanivorans]
MTKTPKLVRVTIIIGFIFFVCLNGHAQDTLVLRNGKRIGILRLAMANDHLKVKNSLTKEFEAYPFDSVFGYTKGSKERAYFLKKNPGMDYSGYFFLKRIAVGRLTLFENTGNDQSLYLEKDGRFEKVFGVTESKAKKAKRLQVFQSFVSDDEESTAYLNAPELKYKWDEIITVVEHYNERNFVERLPQSSDVLGRVYLYRTQFQKTKQGIKIKLYGKDHDLYIEDFIMLNLPVEYASQLHLRDSEVRSTHEMSGELNEQFFEVLLDPGTNTFRFDKKKGTELQYEFFKIRDQVNKKINN